MVIECTKTEYRTKFIFIVKPFISSLYSSRAWVWTTIQFCSQLLSSYCNSYSPISWELQLVKWSRSAGKLNMWKACSLSSVYELMLSKASLTNESKHQRFPQLSKIFLFLFWKWSKKKTCVYTSKLLTEVCSVVLVACLPHKCWEIRPVIFWSLFIEG